MYKITTYEDGSKSIVTTHPDVSITVTADGEQPVKVVETNKLPKTALGKLAEEVSNYSPPESAE